MLPAFASTAVSAKFSGLSRLRPAQVAALANGAYDLPDDYLEFMAKVGAGEVGDAEFMFYPGPIEPADIYDEEFAESLSDDDIMLFGDDLSGHTFGFDADGDIFEISPEVGAEPMDVTFAEFLESLIETD